eukprot:m.275215 g.275215  ORF g.275215 m.275215 type:complete len:330 (-) comp116889_c0_seq1:1-990(-)
MKAAVANHPRVISFSARPDGFGFEVVGNGPVFVEVVNTDGAAAMAGLVPGDRLVGINGARVSRSSHDDVVGLIRQARTSLRLVVINDGGVNHGIPANGQTRENPSPMYDPENIADLWEKHARAPQSPKSPDMTSKLPIASPAPKNIGAKMGQVPHHKKSISSTSASSPPPPPLPPPPMTITPTQILCGGQLGRHSLVPYKGGRKCSKCNSVPNFDGFRKEKTSYDATLGLCFGKLSKSAVENVGGPKQAIKLLLQESVIKKDGNYFIKAGPDKAAAVRAKLRKLRSKKSGLIAIPPARVSTPNTVSSNAKNKNTPATTTTPTPIVPTRR